MPRGGLGVADREVDVCAAIGFRFRQIPGSGAGAVSAGDPYPDGRLLQAHASSPPRRYDVIR